MTRWPTRSAARAASSRCRASSTPGAAKDRFIGLEASLADNPGVELLDQQTANFSRQEALAVTETLLTKHGDKVKGIWAANDDMALGALQALEQAGRTDVAVVGIDAVPDA